VENAENCGKLVFPLYVFDASKNENVSNPIATLFRRIKSEAICEGFGKPCPVCAVSVVSAVYKNQQLTCFQQRWAVQYEPRQKNAPRFIGALGELVCDCETNNSGGRSSRSWTQSRVFAQPLDGGRRSRENRRDPLFPQTNSVWVPHVRTSVRGLTKTGRSPIKGPSFSLCRSSAVTDGVFLLREPHPDHQSHESPQEIRGSVVEGPAVSRHPTLSSDLSHSSPLVIPAGAKLVEGPAVSPHSTLSSDLSHSSPLVIPTGAKRSGGICSAPCGALKSFLEDRFSTRRGTVERPARRALKL
jgi:hypothetical protein